MARLKARPDTLTLDDPRAIRALAHEVRQEVITELYSGVVLTATEAARICGVTPSAMSYHLRALEKWGIVEREKATTDGRERPWRASAKHLNIGPGTSRAAGPVITQAFFASYLGAIRRVVEAWAGRAVNETDRSAQMSRARMWLDDDEATALNREIDAALARYEDRPVGDRPEGAIPRDCFWINVPHREVSDSRRNGARTR